MTLGVSGFMCVCIIVYEFINDSKKKKKTGLQTFLSRNKFLIPLVGSQKKAVIGKIC